MCLVRNPTLAPQLEKTHETPPSSRDEGLLFLHGLESNLEAMEFSQQHYRTRLPFPCPIYPLRLCYKLFNPFQERLEIHEMKVFSQKVQVFPCPCYNPLLGRFLVR